jgi:N-acetylmuramoyl-L-alanine amidase
VKQAGFLVLYRSNMPSVLVETGFLTHGGDEKYLTSSAGQTSVAEDIAVAFSDYRMQVQKAQ